MLHIELLIIIKRDFIHSIFLISMHNVALELIGLILHSIQDALKLISTHGT